MITCYKHMIKFLASILVLTLICCGLSSCFSNHCVYTENSADYNLYEHKFFPSEIPKSAEILKFSKYEYWVEDYDTYLELKFNTVEELEHHLGNLKDNIKNSVKKEIYPNNESLFLEVENPYDSTYTDVFVLCYATWSDSQRYTGYEFEIYEDYSVLDCNFLIISYSYEDLILIESATQGSFGDDYGYDYVPKYFERFNIPLDEKCKRIYVTK